VPGLFNENELVNVNIAQWKF